MKRLLLLLPLLAIAGTAQAAPIYLSCDETEVTKEVHKIETAGRISYPRQDFEPWKDIPITMFPENGTGKVWSTSYSLVAYPDKYELRIMKLPSAVGVYPSKSQITTYTINRSTLKMNYRNVRTSTDRLPYIGGFQKSTSERESVGICKIAPAPANNQI